jgi:GntR family transcriptional repressor for pyruvate dehydrogenase complex
MPLPPLAPVSAPVTLTDRVASELLNRIEDGQLLANHQLPTEAQMSEQFGVSRTVVREAVNRLKSMGRLVSRQGSGVFVAPPHSARALAFDPAVLGSLEAVLQVVEVRRVLEGEVCALAAERITEAKARQIRQALERLLAAVEQGQDGVEEDLALHRSIARAADNPHFEHLLGFLEQYQRDAMRVTRANEAMHQDFMRAVNREHEALVQAISRGDRAGARRAAIRHMANAATRIEKADPRAKQALKHLLGHPAPTTRH